MKTRFKSIFLDSDQEQAELWKRSDVDSLQKLGSKVLYDFAMHKVKDGDRFDEKTIYITWNKIYYSNIDSDTLMGMIELDWLGVEFIEPSPNSTDKDL